jgi:hypothetical protein
MIEHDAMGGYDCLLPFDTDDPAFVRGFEAGRVWARLRATGEPVEEHVHAANAEMVLRMAEATGRDVRSEELGGEWLLVTFSEPAWLDSAM